MLYRIVSLVIFFTVSVADVTVYKSDDYYPVSLVQTQLPLMFKFQRDLFNVTLKIFVINKPRSFTGTSIIYETDSGTAMATYQTEKNNKRQERESYHMIQVNKIKFIIINLELSPKSSCSSIRVAEGRDLLFPCPHTGTKEPEKFTSTIDECNNSICELYVDIRNACGDYPVVTDRPIEGVKTSTMQNENFNIRTSHRPATQPRMHQYGYNPGVIDRTKEYVTTTSPNIRTYNYTAPQSYYPSGTDRTIEGVKTTSPMNTSMSNNSTNRDKNNNITTNNYTAPLSKNYSPSPSVDVVLMYLIPSVIMSCVIMVVIYKIVKKYYKRNPVSEESMEFNNHVTRNEVVYADLSLAPGNSHLRPGEEAQYAKIVGVLKPANENIAKK